MGERTEEARKLITWGMRGFELLPVYPKDDSLDCTWHCKCGLNIIYLFGEGNYDVYWLLDVDGVEHCDSCLGLAASWRPLSIRKGFIVNQKQVHAVDIAMLRLLIGQEITWTNNPTISAA